MSSHNAAHQLFRAPVLKVDPGASGELNVDRSPCMFALESAAAETRTLNAPTRAGAIVTVSLLTDGGNVTVTVTGGYNEAGDTTFVLANAGEFAVFQSIKTAAETFVWRKIASDTNTALITGAGTGITAGTGTVYESSVMESGGIIITNILIDLTGLHSEATDLDIIGVDGSANPAHIGQITAAQNGTILGGTMRCLEAPAGGDPNLSLYAADEGTGVEDQLITALTNDAVVFDPAADWTVDMDRSITGMPGANQYLYLVQTDAAGTDADYTAGKFLITLVGYRA